jgi:hypothetical protein
MLHVHAQRFSACNLIWVMMNQYIDSDDDGLKQRARTIWNEVQVLGNETFDLAVQAHQRERESNATYQDTRRRMARPWNEYIEEQYHSLTEQLAQAQGGNG